MENCNGCKNRVDASSLGWINTRIGNGRRWVKRCSECRDQILTNDRFAIEQTESER